MTLKLKNDQSAFLLPSILVMMGIIAIVGFSTMSAARGSLLGSFKQTYFQIAHIASKAAFDLAKEEFEKDPDYNGTAEIDLQITSKYRVTIQVDVLSTVGNIKDIQAFGRVYLPETSATASFVRDIKGGIIRDGITAGNPADYSPTLWLDASDPTTLLNSSSSNSQFITSPRGSSNGSLVEERGADANNNPGRLDWGGDDLEMAWNGSSRGTQTIGVRFPGATVPQGATINNAYIQFTTDETKRAGTMSFDISGVASDNAPIWSGNYAVTNATKTTGAVDWDPVDWNIVGEAGANERSPDLTAIVQEIVNRPGWTTGNAMAFSVAPDTGFMGNGWGIRTAGKGQSGDTAAPQLYIEWDTTSSQASDGQDVVQWNDISGSANNAQVATGLSGTAPTKRDGTLNGNATLEFRGSDLLQSTLASGASGNAVTAFMVMRPASSSSNLDRFLSMMNTAQNEDYNTSNGAALFYKSDTTGANSVRSFYNNQGGEHIVGAVDDQWAIYSVRLSSSYVERLRRNGLDNYSSLIGTVNYTINEIFVGGHRSGASGIGFGDVDIAELVVYDHDLQCSEMLTLENYFSGKWGVTLDASAGCS